MKSVNKGNYYWKQIKVLTEYSNSIEYTNSSNRLISDSLLSTDTSGCVTNLVVVEVKGINNMLQKTINDNQKRFYK